VLGLEGLPLEVILPMASTRRDAESFGLLQIVSLLQSGGKNL